MVCTGFTLLHYPESLRLPLIKPHDQPFAIELHFENTLRVFDFKTLQVIPLHFKPFH